MTTTRDIARDIFGDPLFSWQHHAINALYHYTATAFNFTANDNDVSDDAARYVKLIHALRDGAPPYPATEACPTGAIVSACALAYGKPSGWWVMLVFRGKLDHVEVGDDPAFFDGLQPDMRHRLDTAYRIVRIP